MRTEKEIREKIKKLTLVYKHILDCRAATVFNNAPRALMQVEAASQLDALYWTLGEKRPKFKCDES